MVKIRSRPRAAGAGETETKGSMMTAAEEKQYLFSAIWDLACKFVHAGGADNETFKQYVLGFLFYRFLSENLTDYINKNEQAEDPEFDYAKASDEEAEDFREDMIGEKGYFILPSELFCNVAAQAEQDADLNIRIGAIFKNITSSAKGRKAEESIKGLFDDIDLASSHLAPTPMARQESIIRILQSFSKLKLSLPHEREIDIFGDAYEYLIKMYAATAGKKGGEYFTPQEVSDLLARITIVGKTKVNKVYDPACGSGSLLLRFAKILGKENVENGFYGQELKLTTYNLCRMNMFLHNIPYDKFNIQRGDTLTDPKHRSFEPFEAIVSNPPYSVNWAGDDSATLINDERFAPAGVLAPKSKADLAFVMHSLSWLAESGTAAIVSFPGVMYRGGAERQIRKYLVDNNFVECIIALPDKLFFRTSISTCILVLKRNKQDDKTLFIDASREYIAVTNQNKLTEKNRNKILTAYESRADIEHFARLASAAEIAAQDYNLSVGAYVLPPDTREKINIKQLNAEIAELVAKEDTLRCDIDAIIAEIEGAGA